MIIITSTYWKFIRRIQNKNFKNFVYFLGSPLPVKCIAACFVTAISCYSYSSDESLVLVLMAAAIGWFSAAAWLHYNDLWDQELDKLNHPMRPLASGDITLNAAIKATIASFILSVGASYLLGTRASVFTLIHLGMALIYPVACRLSKVFANLIGAWTVLNPQLIFGPVVEQGIINNFCIFVLCLYPLSIASQFQLDMADVAGDQLLGLKTFASTYGRRNTLFAITTLIILSVTLCLSFDLVNYYYLVAFISYTAIYVFSFIALIVVNTSQENHEKFLYRVEYASRTLIFSVLLLFTSPNAIKI